jgi:hypothetical protein
VLRAVALARNARTRFFASSFASHCSSTPDRARASFADAPVDLPRAPFAQRAREARGTLARPREDDDARHGAVEAVDDAEEDVAGLRELGADPGLAWS